MAIPGLLGAEFGSGNTLTDASGRGFAWDFENRLVQATNPGVGTTAFKYDPFGRRIQKSGPLGTTNYLYDGDNSIDELDQGGNVRARYAEGEGLDEALAEFRSETSRYHEADGLNSVTSLTSSSATIVTTYDYDSFGHLSNSTGALLSSLQYTGREFDPETGLSYYRARYYDPQIGRFIVEDPMGFGAGENFFAYTLNNPVLLIDPFGLDLTPAQKAAVQRAARDWANSKVPYKYGGKTKKGADCSGSVHGVYEQAGIPFPYTTSAGFKNSPYFYQVPAGDSPQVGDIAVFPGHIAIYDPNAGPGKDVWSASHTGGPDYGPAASSWYGKPTYYRWK